MTMAEKRSLSRLDPNSFSNPEDIIITHLHLNWKVDFSRKVITGSARYDLLATCPRSNKLILDTHDLEIKSVVDQNGSELNFEIGNPFMTMGRPLVIQLASVADTNKTVQITIEYETSPTAESLQWLSKEQTHGKEFPYLFSQCQAIHARSLVPCQDTPFVKATYSANVKAPKDLVVLMSALQEKVPEVIPSDSENLLHSFSQRVGMPSYLIAIVVGKLESVELGPRSRCWSETDFLKLAAHDFADTEKMLQTAESICGEYVWGRYDLLVLPPSFPYGGMENPCLTFVTPNLLTGDKSRADIIAHEITHSWTGNLVTNKNFEHFWLNEGFTRFIERKIVGRLWGEPMRHFSALLGWSDLVDCVKALGETNPLTQLVVDLHKVDPEDAFSRVPYEKGSNFLFYLEQKVGGAEVFEPFLKVYIKEYAYKSIDTDVFKSFFIDYFTKLGKSEDIKDIAWDSWLFSPGMPIIKPDYDTSLVVPCVKLSEKWINWNPAEEKSPFSRELDLKDLKPNQIAEFLNQLIASEAPFTIVKAKAMEKAYCLQNSTNTEFLFRWIRLICKAQWIDRLHLALDLVTKNGRLKYLQPIYRDLYKWEEARPQAIETFQRNRPTMMHASVFVTAKILGLSF